MEGGLADAVSDPNQLEAVGSKYRYRNVNVTNYQGPTQWLAIAELAIPDTGTFPGMTDIAWTTDPLNAANACASLNIITFNASVSTYDNDQTTSSIFGATTPAAQTKLIGDDEHVTGNAFFSGRAGASGLAVSFVSPGTEAHFRLIEKRQGLSLPLEVVAGYEPTEAPALPNQETVPGTGGIKGKRPSKKDKLRAAAARAAQA